LKRYDCMFCYTQVHILILLMENVWKYWKERVYRKRQQLTRSKVVFAACVWRLMDVRDSRLTSAFKCLLLMSLAVSSIRQVINEGVICPSSLACRSAMKRIRVGHFFYLETLTALSYISVPQYASSRARLKNFKRHRQRRKMTFVHGLENNKGGDGYFSALFSCWFWTDRLSSAIQDW